MLQERIWAQGLRDVKLCVIDNGQQVVLLGRMPYDEEDEMRGKQVIQVRDAMSGGITSQWESQCQHSFSIRLRLASWRSNNTPYLAHSCPVCEAVDVYDVSRKQLITKYEEDDMSPGAICRGPGTDTLLLVDGKGKRIQQLQWRGDSFQPIRPIQHNHPDRYPCISYSSLHGNIYLAGQYTVSCISLLEGQSGHPLWQLGGLGVDVGEQQLDSTMSVCCDPAGRVYISECNRDRLLVVDGETGELRHVQSGMIPRQVHHAVMHDSDSGIGIDSGITQVCTGIGINKIKLCWNRNRNQGFLYFYFMSFLHIGGIGIGIKKFLLELELGWNQRTLTGIGIGIRI